ncbi:MAG: tripartite tricarboxylate transporter substrate binding protein [Rhodospirillaceae bacterium]
MSISIKLAGRAVAAAALAFAVAGNAAAAEKKKYPCDIEVVIHSSYGGGTDVTARMMMIRSRRELGVDMSVSAKRGGSGAKAQAYVLSKPADGCTLMALTQTHLYTMARGKSEMKIDDIVGIARAMDDPTFVVTSSKGPYKSLEDLIAASKKGPLNWGVAQIGGTEHIGLANLAKAAGFTFKVVPFGSGAQMVQALLSGAIDATLPNVSEAGNQVNDGSFLALAVMAEKRLADYPNVPTTFEKGFKVKTSTTRGYAVKAGTPQDKIDWLSKALTKAMSHEVFVNYLGSAGLKPEDSVAGTSVWDKQLKEEYKTAYDSLKELDLLK